MDTRPHIQNNIDRNVVNSSVDRLSLKVKFRSGQCILSELTGESTVKDLVDAVSSVVNEKPSTLRLSFGYPPKQLSFSGDSQNLLLKQVPLLSGDTLIVDSINPAVAPASQPSTTTSIAANAKSDFSNPHLVRLTAPSDNSCLFTSVLFCVDNADKHQPIGAQVITNTAAVAQMRELIASIVLSDPDRYSEAFLGMPNFQYSQSIQQPDKWGGGIEVAILSQVYEIEICLVDIQTGRIDRFGEDHNYDDRILLIYDGIHYDPLALTQPDTGKLRSIFPVSNVQVLLDAQTLAAEARATWRFTDTACFTLICRQ